MSAVKKLLRCRLLMGLLVFFTSGFYRPIIKPTGSMRYTTGYFLNGPDQRVEKALKKLGYKYEINSNGNFKLVFSRKNGRSQVAFIVSETSRIYELELRDIWSPIAQLGSSPSASVSKKLLEYNSKFKMGRVIYKVLDGTYYAVFVVTISADASAEELETVLSAVTGTADDLEQELTKADKF